MRTTDRLITTTERLRVAQLLVGLAALALLCHGCAPAQRQGAIEPRGYRPTDELAVYRIDVGDEATCTAWKLADPLDLLVTANHCCEHPDEAIVVHGRPASERLYPVAADPVGDACLLLPGAPDYAPPGAGLELARKDPPIGATVWMRGYPFARLAVSQGLWSGIDSGDCGATLYAGPGASGAPIVDADGRVLCVVTSYPRSGPGLSLGCPAARVRALVRAYEDPPEK